MQKKKKSIKEIIFGKGDMDTVFFVILLVILTVGLVMLFSASYAYCYAQFGDSYRFIARQALFAVAGLVLMYLASRLNVKYLRKILLEIFF